MAPKTAKANLFEVSGGATSVTYSTTTITGRPSFHFRDGDHDVEVEGSDIRTRKTELGTLVTVDLDVVEDGPTTSATLLLPTVNLGQTAEQKLRTLVIVTTTADTIGGPALVVGQVQRYKSVTVRGTARSVTP
ncbi:MAG: hypothetical protein QOG82_18 [Actinomycetota bacterium]|jgi:hypothetical protein|nr:hypothetical protein [Actinomycetota bacterium]